MRQWRRPLDIPEQAHPLVRRLVREMNAQRIGPVDLAEKAGLNKDTIRSWRTKHAPSVDLLDAAFGALGLEMRVAERRER